MAKSPGRKTKKAKAKAAPNPARSPAKKATATKKPAKRYKATPADMSDRQHLEALIQNTTGSSAMAAKETLNGLIGTITASLKKNKKVQLFGFGAFVVAKRPARKGWNPRTRETIRTKASKTVRFRAGRTLKRSV